MEVKNIAKTQKVISFPYGPYGETLTWAVGDGYVRIYGGTEVPPFLLTYISTYHGKPFYEVLLEKISEKL